MRNLAFIPKKSDKIQEWKEETMNFLIDETLSKDMDGLTWQWAPKPLSKAGEPIRSAVA
jgi:hypothetical protein